MFGRANIRLGIDPHSIVLGVSILTPYRTGTGGFVMCSQLACGELTGSLMSRPLLKASAHCSSSPSALPRYPTGDSVCQTL